MHVLQLIFREFGDLPSLDEFIPVAVRLLAALLLGGLLGFERESVGKAAGLRTHMLVALGAALFFVLAERMNMETADQSRVIQGLVSGIGFLGAGVILKQSEQGRIKGVTTAAGVWTTAAIGATAGAGKLATASLAAILALGVLGVVQRFERRAIPESDDTA